MLKVKETIKAKVESLDKDKLKKNVKRVAIGAAVGVTGFVGYEIGKVTGVIQSGLCVNRVLDDHPDLKDQFFEAWDETMNNLNK